MIVIKRDGSIQEFEYKKIVRSVSLAFQSANVPVDDKFMEQLKNQFDKVCDNADSDCKINVEDIQDIIQKELIKRNKYDVVESFILERKKRQEVRESKSDLIKNIKKALNASDIQNQNANVDEASFGGRMGEATRVVTKDMALKMMSKMARKNHESNMIYIHDLDSYVAGMHNCLSIPFDDLLRNGFNTRQCDVRPANSVNTAFQLVAVLFQLQSLQQFGGVSATHIDWTMVPYVRKSFFKHYNDVRNTLPFLGYFELSDKDIENTEINDKAYRGNHWYNIIKRYVWKKAISRTNKEIHQAVEGMYHNLNTLQSRSGNQLPFTSINYGTCTNMSGRMVIKALLDVSISGLGKYHKTSIFPCGIFQYMKGVNDKKGTPNYDLYRLALKSTAKRIYPNYCNVDWSVNEGYDRNDPTTYVSTMGCHAAGTKIIMADGTKKNVEDIEVGDKLMGVNGGIRTVQSLIRGNDKMFRIKQSRSEDYIVNEGHILALEYSSNRKYKSFKKGDRVNMSVHDLLEIPQCTRRFFKGYKEGYELSEKEFDIPPYILGLWLGDGCKSCTRFSVNESETQILEDLGEYAKTINKKLTIRQEEDEKCLEVSIADQSTANDGNILRQALISYNLLNNKHIPECYYYGSKEQRSALLAGLINTDGWKREDRGACTVVFGNTNLDLINGAKRLADSLGYTTTIIKARDESIGKGICEGCLLKPYYYLSIHGFDDSHLMPNKKLSRTTNRIRNFSTSTLKIEEVDKENYYGFELDGDKLYIINDGTVTHNCRTYNGFDINGLGQKKDGRGNICPVTIILPTLAMESKLKIDKKFDNNDNLSSEDRYIYYVEEFMKLLDKKISEGKDMLIERFEHICSQSPESAVFMWENNTMAGYVPEEGIRSALKHGTLALGQLGLAECLQILIGKNHTTDEGMALAKRIESLFNKRCKEFKNEYKLNFGVYYTPAENLCYTAMKKFRSKYGIIKNVSDREYFTNSIHVPVWEEVNPFEKIDIESQLTSYSNAGCITYVELPSTAINNIDAIETMVNYAMDHDIPYFALNFPLDTCNHCHAQGDFNGVCPECGSTDIDELRRVTGYLSTTKKHFNKGKQCETDDRVKHIKN